MTHPLAEPVRIRGVVYPSYRAAAEALGVTQSTVSKAVSIGRADSVGLNKAKELRKVELLRRCLPFVPSCLRAEIEREIEGKQ